MKINLRIPGPTPLPSEVLQATAQQMINHRGHAYEELHSRVLKNLKHFFQTENDMLLLTSSGTGGFETAVANLFSAGDTIVSFTCGIFGERWADCARAFGLNVVQVKFAPGEAVSQDEVYRVLETTQNLKGVFFTHNETAVGVLNKIKEFAPLVREHKDKPLLLVDAISSLGAVDLPMDETGIDVIFSASQKAWMAPPGLCMFSLSQKAWEFHKRATLPRYYFDIGLYKEFNEKNQTPATPAVSAIFGLDAALTLMLKEGRENVYKRHLDLMRYTREEVEKLGLFLFVKDEDASPTVTSLVVPEGVDASNWLKILREKYNLVLAGGMGETKGKILRIAHMGYVSKEDIDRVISALKESLSEIHP